MPQGGSIMNKIDMLIKSEFVLPLDQSVYVTKEDKHLAISGWVDFDLNKIILTMGDLREVSIPFCMFKPTGTGLKPNFSECSLDDCGQTLVLGEYEAAVESILKDLGLWTHSRGCV